MSFLAGGGYGGTPGGILVSAGTSSQSTGMVVFSNSNGVSFGLNASTLTMSVAGGGGGGSVNVSAGTTSQNLTNFVFSNSNNITFGLNGSTITASAAAGGGGITNVNLSAGTTSQNLSNFVFSNSNGVSFGLNGSTVTGSHNGLTSQSNQALSAANGSFTFQTATFANSNGISFSTGTQGIYASHNGLTSQSNQALSGSNGSFTFQTATFGNLNGLSFYTSNGSLVASYTVPSVPAQTNQTLGAYAVSNTTQSSSGTFDARSFSIQGAGGVSVGVSNGSVIISGATGGGGGGITNINLSAGTTSNNLSNFVFSNSNGVSFGLNGSTITASAAGGGGGAAGISYWANYKDLGHVTRGVRFGGGTFWNNRPIFVPGYVEGSGLIASRIRFHIERSSNSTLDLTWAAGVYSVVNATSLSLMGSSSAAFSLTNNTQWNNIRILDITGMSSLTVPQGHIVIGMHISAQGASTDRADFNFYGANRITPPNGYLLAGTNSTAATASNSIQYPFHGAYSATSAGFPANVASADLQHGSRINQMIDIFGSGL